MSKYWKWFLPAGCWVLITIIHLFNEQRRSGIVIGFCLFVVLLFSLLGLLQYLCDEKSLIGKKTLKYIQWGVVVFLAALLGILFIVGF